MEKRNPEGVLLTILLLSAVTAVGGEIYLPPDPVEAKTPEPRTLTAEEESRASPHDSAYRAHRKPRSARRRRGRSRFRAGSTMCGLSARITRF